MYYQSKMRKKDVQAAVYKPTLIDDVVSQSGIALIYQRSDLDVEYRLFTLTGLYSGFDMMSNSEETGVISSYQTSTGSKYDMVEA